MTDSLSVSKKTFMQDIEEVVFFPLERYLAAKYEHHDLFFSFFNLHSHFIIGAGLVEVHLLREGD